MYYDEDLLLDIRLNSLDKFVKKFVITEATYTHNGNKKKLNFNIANFRKFKDKINYIVVDKQPENILTLKNDDTKDEEGEKLILNGMARDYFQREALSKGLKNAAGDDLILISDLDEIPNLESFDFSFIKDKIRIFKIEFSPRKNRLVKKIIFRILKVVKVICYSTNFSINVF